MSSERRLPPVIAWIATISLVATGFYWIYVGMEASSVSNTATGQVFDISGGRHHLNQGAYVTWPQLKTIILLGLPALVSATIWFLQQIWRDRRDR